jgi:hypothetical protein
LCKGIPVNGPGAKHWTARVVADRERKRKDRNRERNMTRKGVRRKQEMKTEGSKE